MTGPAAAGSAARSILKEPLGSMPRDLSQWAGTSRPLVEPTSAKEMPRPFASSGHLAISRSGRPAMTAWQVALPSYLTVVMACAAPWWLASTGIGHATPQ